MASEADLRMEIAISRMLLAGVSTAAIVVLIGGLVYLWQAHGVAPDYRHFHRVPNPGDRLWPSLEGIRHFDSRSIIRLGIVLLIATPIMRVAYCIYGFAVQRDKLYVLISALVLAVLMYSFFRH